MPEPPVSDQERDLLILLHDIRKQLLHHGWNLNGDDINMLRRMKLEYKLYTTIRNIIKDRYNVHTSVNLLGIIENVVIMYTCQRVIVYPPIPIRVLTRDNHNSSEDEYGNLDAVD